MAIRKAQCGVLIFVLTLLSPILSLHPGYASDELYLTGVVKSVDHASATVVVEVLSSSCRGTREFTVDEPDMLDDFIGKKIDFSIDSSTCESGKVYKMFPDGRKWK